MEKGAAIGAVSVYLPETILDNAELVRQFGTWTEKKIFAKTGITKRHVVEEGGEIASDIAAKAGEALFREHGVDRRSIDFLLLCTETPDYFLPATACVVHDRLGLHHGAGAVDYNLGCSGFIYGLAMAKGLVAGGVVKRVLLITADTITRVVHPMDKSTRTIFGDGAAAVLIEEGAGIGEFDLGTDGSGASKLIVPAGAWARPSSEETRVETTNRWGNTRTPEHMYMDGPEILKFTMEVADLCMKNVFRKNGVTMDDIDLVVPHQASMMVLENLRDGLGIPPEKFVINIENYGNTTSSTIPITLRDAARDGRLKKGGKVLLMGFGVGLSWGGVIIEW